MRNPVSPGLLGMEDQEEAEEKQQRYRLYVLYRMENLRFLDCNDVSKQEKEMAKRRGQFMITRQPKQAAAPAGAVEEEEVKASNVKKEGRAFLALGSNT